jgi:hypothetical protein
MTELDRFKQILVLIGNPIWLASELESGDAFALCEMPTA